MNKEQYLRFTHKLNKENAPSVKEAAKQVGLTIPKIKKFMKSFYSENEGGEEETRYEQKTRTDVEIFRMMQLLASKNAADLLVRGKVTEGQATKYLGDNGYSPSYLPQFKEHAEKRKKSEDWYNEVKQKHEASIE